MTDKFCVECKHMGDRGDVSFARCKSPQTYESHLDPVTGRMMKIQQVGFVSLQRAVKDPLCCGPDAKFFEQRIPSKFETFLTRFGISL